MAEPTQQSAPVSEQAAAAADKGKGVEKKGAQTTDYYRTFGVIPKRFNNPEIANNAGNVVFTCGEKVSNLPPHAGRDDEWFEGYNLKTENPMFITTSSDYGRRPPTVHTCPTIFKARTQQFTGDLGKCGMYRNHSLNTSSDKSIV